MFVIECVRYAMRPTIESGAKAPRKAGVRRRATILWLEAATRAAEQLHYMLPKKDQSAPGTFFT